MTELTFRSDFKVGLVDHAGGDEAVLRAMLVASDLDNPDEWAITTSPKNVGRINALMRDRHGSPFEHNMMTFYVEAPIMVFREWHRHRIGVSINEQSGRYSELPPMFYLPPRHRPIVKVEGTKQMDYVSELGTDEQYDVMVDEYNLANQVAYTSYQTMLDNGIVKEVARGVLPVNIYSKMYWTCNARSLMSFLSLRVRAEPFLRKGEYSSKIAPDPQEIFVKNPGGSMFPSKPQWEINECALLMESAAEECFATLFPVTYAAFVANGRVSP